MEGTKIACEFGSGCAKRGIEIIYGGGAVGLMGVAADAALSNGGRVTGIIPRFLAQLETPDANLTELVEVNSMQERIQRMLSRSDGFVALPGGYGTLEEISCIISWRLLELHNKPIVLLDYKDYWNPFMSLIDHFVVKGFAGNDTRNLFSIGYSTDEVLDQLSYT